MIELNKEIMESLPEEVVDFISMRNEVSKLMDLIMNSNFEEIKKFVQNSEFVGFEFVVDYEVNGIYVRVYRGPSFPDYCREIGIICALSGKVALDDINDIVSGDHDIVYDVCINCDTIFSSIGNQIHGFKNEDTDRLKNLQKFLKQFFVKDL